MNSNPVLLARDRHIENLLSTEIEEDGKVVIIICKGLFDNLTYSEVR
ncbi:MAG: hypothetical protein JRJ23_08365 [Deltaproteobacteria bacterium]|nr:hypothetical protein [Deltaproteobacteria bacterium]